MSEINILEPLKVTRSSDGVIIAHWVQGQKVYLVSDELLKALIDELNNLRVCG